MDDKDIKTQKNAYRLEIKSRIHQIPHGLRRLKNRQIFEFLKKKSSFSNAKSLFSYLSAFEEVDTFEIISTALSFGKTVFVPRIIDKSRFEIVSIQELDCLVIGKFGILQPKAGIKACLSLPQIDLVIVPGLAFTLNGDRLGRGGGYFDRFLAQFPGSFKVALAYQEQMVETLPVEPHDIKMDEIIFDSIEKGTQSGNN